MGLIGDVLGATVFAMFVVLSGLASSRSLNADDALQRARQRLILFCVTVSFVVGLAQRPLWPFSDWPMDNHVFADEFAVLRPLAVDSEGREHEIDPRAFHPLDWGDTYTWLERQRGADESIFTEVAPWLLERLRAARRTVDGGQRLGPRLGRFAAPPRTVLPATWLPGDSLERATLRGIRIYEYRSHLDSLPPDPERSTRTLLFEYIER